MKTTILFLMLFAIGLSYSQENVSNRFYWYTDTVDHAGDTIPVFDLGFRERYKFEFIADSTGQISWTADYDSTQTIEIRQTSTVIETYALPAGVWLDPKSLRDLFVRKKSEHAGQMDYRIYIYGR